MSRLSPEQQQLILDFYFRCGEEKDINKGRDLIASNPEAAKLYAGLEETLTELDSVKYEPCPDNLAELTVARLKLAARAGMGRSSQSSSRLVELLDQESQKNFRIPQQPTSKPVVSASDSKPNFLKIVFEFAAMAAAIVLISGLLIPPIHSMRSHSQQVACASNLGTIGSGLKAYASDHDGRFVSAEVQPGDPWNTRHAWKLVKLGYVEGEHFICKGHKDAQPLTYNPETMANMQDFASPQNVSFSITFVCNSKNPTMLKTRKVIMSDMNPIFIRYRRQASLYDRRNEFEKVLLNEDLKKLLSPNHNQRGQNILLCDGSVEFIVIREYEGDDIFTIRGVDAYTGREVPHDEKDTFLIP